MPNVSSAPRIDTSSLPSGRGTPKSTLVKTSSLRSLLRPGSGSGVSAKEVNVSVSSTLDKTVGKHNILDGSVETCWSSSEGLPQYIALSFPKLLPATHISITFQGGFVGTTCALYLASARPGREVNEIGNLGLVFVGNLYPKDINERQVFEIPLPEAIVDTMPPSPFPGNSSLPGTDTEPKGEEWMVQGPEHREWIKEIKLVFEKSSDPFGRVVVYDLELLEAQ